MKALFSELSHFDSKSKLRHRVTRVRKADGSTFFEGKRRSLSLSLSEGDIGDLNLFDSSSDDLTPTSSSSEDAFLKSPVVADSDDLFAGQYPDEAPTLLPLNCKAYGYNRAKQRWEVVEIESSMADSSHLHISELSVAFVSMRQSEAHFRATAKSPTATSSFSPIPMAARIKEETTVLTSPSASSSMFAAVSSDDGCDTDSTSVSTSISFDVEDKGQCEHKAAAKRKEEMKAPKAQRKAMTAVSAVYDSSVSTVVTSTSVSEHSEEFHSDARTEAMCLAAKAAGRRRSAPLSASIFAKGLLKDRKMTTAKSKAKKSGRKRKSSKSKRKGKGRMRRRKHSQSRSKPTSRVRVKGSVRARLPLSALLTTTSSSSPSLSLSMSSPESRDSPAFGGTRTGGFLSHLKSFKKKKKKKQKRKEEMEKEKKKRELDEEPKAPELYQFGRRRSNPPVLAMSVGFEYYDDVGCPSDSGSSSLGPASALALHVAHDFSEDSVSDSSSRSISTPNSKQKKRKAIGYSAMRRKSDPLSVDVPVFGLGTLARAVTHSEAVSALDRFTADIASGKRRMSHEFPETPVFAPRIKMGAFSSSGDDDDLLEGTSTVESVDTERTKSISLSSSIGGDYHQGYDFHRTRHRFTEDLLLLNDTHSPVITTTLSTQTRTASGSGSKSTSTSTGTSTSSSSSELQTTAVTPDSKGTNHSATKSGLFVSSDMLSPMKTFKSPEDITPLTSPMTALSPPPMDHLMGLAYFQRHAHAPSDASAVEGSDTDSLYSSASASVTVSSSDKAKAVLVHSSSSAERSAVESLTTTGKFGVSLSLSTLSKAKAKTSGGNTAAASCLLKPMDRLSIEALEDESDALAPLSAVKQKRVKKRTRSQHDSFHFCDSDLSQGTLLISGSDDGESPMNTTPSSGKLSVTGEEKEESGEEEKECESVAPSPMAGVKSESGKSATAHCMKICGLEEAFSEESEFEKAERLKFSAMVHWLDAQRPSIMIFYSISRAQFESLMTSCTWIQTAYQCTDSERGLHFEQWNTVVFSAMNVSRFEVSMLFDPSKARTPQRRVGSLEASAGSSILASMRMRRTRKSLDSTLRSTDYESRRKQMQGHALKCWLISTYVNLGTLSTTATALLKSSSIDDYLNELKPTDATHSFDLRMPQMAGLRDGDAMDGIVLDTVTLASALKSPSDAFAFDFGGASSLSSYYELSTQERGSSKMRVSFLTVDCRKGMRQCSALQCDQCFTMLDLPGTDCDTLLLAASHKGAVCKGTPRRRGKCQSAQCAQKRTGRGRQKCASISPQSTSPSFRRRLFSLDSARSLRADVDLKQTIDTASKKSGWRYVADDLDPTECRLPSDRLSSPAAARFERGHKSKLDCCILKSDNFTPECVLDFDDTEESSRFPKFSPFVASVGSLECKIFMFTRV